MPTDNRVCFGEENEFRCTARTSTGEHVHPSALICEIGELCPVLPDGQRGWFSVAGRFYDDPAGHPEHCTAEASHPLDAVLSRDAGQQWLWLAAQRMQSRGIKARLSRQNVDHSSDDPECSWACHTSFSTSAGSRLIAEHLAAFLVSKMIFDGAGGISPVRGTEPRFSIAPRLELHTRITGTNTQRSRALVCTRSDLGRPGLASRQQFTCNECLCSQTAEYLRFGTTALMLKLLEGGILQKHPLHLANPVASIGVFAADPACTAHVPLVNGGTISATKIQRHCLDLAEGHSGAAFMPAWTSKLCEVWRAVLDRIELGAPESVVGVLDWATRWQLFTHYANGRGSSWLSCIAQLLEIDIRFGELGPDGFWNQLDAENILKHRMATVDQIHQAMHQPPAGTRARPRGDWILRLAGESHSRDDLICLWNGIEDHRHHRLLDLSDPWCVTPEWRTSSVPRTASLGARYRRSRPAGDDEVPF